jgi:hypothetical protein
MRGLLLLLFLDKKETLVEQLATGGIFCSLLASNHKKKAPHRTTSKNGNRNVLPHVRFCSFLHQKSCYKKFHRIEILAMTPRAILLSAAAQLYGLIWWGGSLLHNERAMAIFFGGGSNNHPFGFQRRWLAPPFSIFRLNIFERVVAVFLWCGGVHNEHVWHRYLETHSCC